MNDSLIDNINLMETQLRVSEFDEKVIRADERKKIIEQLEELKSLVPVNRLLDDIIKDKPKELGQIIAYDKAIKIIKGMS